MHGLFVGYQSAPRWHIARLRETACCSARKSALTPISVLEASAATPTATYCFGWIRAPKPDHVVNDSVTASRTILPKYAWYFVRPVHGSILLLYLYLHNDVYVKKNAASRLPPSYDYHVQLAYVIEETATERWTPQIRNPDKRFLPCWERWRNMTWL